MLIDGNLKGYRSEPDDGLLVGLQTILLSDERARSADELQGLRREIRDYFHRTFTLTEKLHEMFQSSADFYVKHERLRHPPIFYLGHTASFYVNKLHLGKFITERIDPVLEMQMAVGVDEMSWDDLDSNSYVWPSGEEAKADELRATAFLQQVIDFRRDVRELVDSMIQSHPMEWPIKKDSFWWVIMMGIEHERIHLETSSVIHRQAPLEDVQVVSVFPKCPHGRFHTNPKSAVAQGTLANTLVPIQAGETRVGRSWESTKTYGWDNEFGNMKMLQVPAFAASEFLVSNKEYLDFVQDGGYSTQSFWSEEGWSWVSDMAPTMPRFWRIHDGAYYLRTLCEEVPMAWDWPAEVCHHEAAAFCKYLSEKTGKSIRLPMEDEFLRLRDAISTDLQDSAHGPSWGSKTPGNVNLAHWGSSCPVNMFRSPSGVFDVLGNVWQHSVTDIDVLEGFTSHPLYDDFTTPTVGSMHARILGGSWISTGANGATRDSRYGFRRHFYQHAGFRYVETDRPVPQNQVSPYETDRKLCDDFRFHFDSGREGECFHERLAQVCVDTLSKLGKRPEESRALEIGCGPGRTSLELARRGLGSVFGADRSAKGFQCTAQRLLQGRPLRWTNYLEGEHVHKRELVPSELGLGSEAAVQFHQIPDFAAVDRKKFQDFDLVVVAQPGVLTSCDAPGLFASAHSVLRPGGILAVGTQYDWRVQGVEGSTGVETLETLLRPGFRAIAEPTELPFLKAETARKFEAGVQHVTFWERRADVDSSYGEGFSGTATTAESSQKQAGIGQDTYEDDLVVGRYLDFHYGPRAAYPAMCAVRCTEVARELGVPMQRALEVGGGPGRAAFELSKTYRHVDAGDHSEAFVRLADQLYREGNLQWRVLEDRTGGNILERSFSLDGQHVDNVRFAWMDAHSLPSELTGYDLVCGFNLIDRLSHPRDFLSTIKARMNPGALLVLSSPYTWLEEFTAQEQWLGGFKYGDNDAPSSYEGMKELLQTQGFMEVKEPEDVWFEFEELGNGRKSQKTCAQMTFWRCL